MNELISLGFESQNVDAFSFSVMQINQWKHWEDSTGNKPQLQKGNMSLKVQNNTINLSTTDFSVSLCCRSNQGNS